MKPLRRASADNIVSSERTFFVTTKTSFGRRLLQSERNAVLLIDVLRSYARARKFRVHDFVVMPDHVHLLVGCDPQFGIHRLVKYLKGTSSRYLRQEFPQLKRRLPSLWTNSYFIATVGGVTLETLKRYVEGQKNR